ncbi:MAG: monovalent cation/H+ antiporter complex subunit F [Planctomycetes bacterium]|nr:monovalent cation/H+ antiporter complex subunit F [Planctomycetota bacterium]
MTLDAAALLLLVTLLVGLARVHRGPTAADRMLAAQLFGTTGVGMLAVLAVADGRPALLDVALALAVLAAVTVVAFARRAAPGGGDA